MKILNKSILKLIFILNIVCVVAEDVATDHIVVQNAVQIEQAVQRPNLILKPTNPRYWLIERELAAIKKYAVAGVANLSNDIAPELHNLVSSILGRLCSKIGLSIPPVQIYFDNSNDTYNAKASMQTQSFSEVLTRSNGKSIQRFEKKYKTRKNLLQLGDGLIKLLLWNADGNYALECVIAHELGHMKQDEHMESIQAEHDADSTAIQLVGKDKGMLLIKSVDTATLAMHVLNILAGQADVFHVSIDDVHQLIRIIVSSIAKNYPTLGDLGKSSSHTKFGLVISKAFTDALKYSFDPKVGLTEENLYKIYNRLEQACQDMHKFMGSDMNAEIDVRCAYIEDYSSRFFSPKTHPTPIQRFNHIQNCILSTSLIRS